MHFIQPSKHNIIVIPSDDPFFLVFLSENFPKSPNFILFNFFPTLYFFYYLLKSWSLPGPNFLLEVLQAS